MFSRSTTHLATSLTSGDLISLKCRDKANFLSWRWGNLCIVLIWFKMISSFYHCSWKPLKFFSFFLTSVFVLCSFNRKSRKCLLKILENISICFFLSDTSLYQHHFELSPPPCPGCRSTASPILPLPQSLSHLWNSLFWTSLNLEHQHVVKMQQITVIWRFLRGKRTFSTVSAEGFLVLAVRRNQR